MSFRLLFILGILSLPLHSQTHVEAKNLLQEASKTMKSFPALEIDFEYNFENTRVDPPIVQKQSGTIAIKGDDYRLKVGGLEQLRVGNKLYNILHDDEEVQVSTYDEEEEDQGLTPSKLLNLFEKGYSYKLGGKESIDSKVIQYIILKPIASEEIDKIQIGILKGSNEVYSMKQWGTNGTVTTLKVKALRKAAKWPANYFSFNRSQYADYYISE